MRQLIERIQNIVEEGGSPIDGKSKGPAINYIRKLLGRTNDGFFSDQYWKPIKKTFEILNKNNIPYVLSSAEYGHEGGIPIRKVWVFEIPYMDKRNLKKKNTIYGRLTAAGAGSVKDPLSKYDVTLVLS